MLTDTINRTLRKMRIMQEEPKRIDEATITGILAYSPADRHNLAMAMDVPELTRDVLEQITVDDWYHARQIVYQANALEAGYPFWIAHSIRAIKKTYVRHPARSIDALVKLARRYGRQYGPVNERVNEFFHEARADLNRILDNAATPRVNWLNYGLTAIAIGTADTLPPEPVPEPVLSDEETKNLIAEQSRELHRQMWADGRPRDFCGRLLTASERL
jgi:hypothetical protein